MKTSLFALGLPVLLFTASALAGPVFTSGSRQVSLVELYTSEGCSSCPPAEKWLSGLTGQEGLWTKFVPVAFHVTYWDHLGWKDVTGKSISNERERAYAASWGTDTVYTPCFVRNGAEWHPSDDLFTADTIHSEVGVLEISKTGDSTVQATFTPASGDQNSYDVTVVLLGSGIQSKIQRGENAGRDLAHDFAVLAINGAALTADKTGKLTATVDLPASGSAPRLALAAWVEQRGSNQPLQATGGWLK